MSTLRVRLFGGVHLWRDGAALPAFPTQKARALFAYLALNRGKTIPRDTLMGVFWGDETESAARRALRTAIWRVRTVVDRDIAEGAKAIVVVGDEVGFNDSAGHWVDVAEFERLLKRVESTDGSAADEKVSLLNDAIELYRGEALEGMYEDWSLYERERLRLQYVTALESLFRAEQEREDWESAIAVGQRLLHVEPLREHVHRDLMRCHVQHGNRPAAVRQYEECSRVLDDELGIRPMDETTILFNSIRSDRVQPGDLEIPVAIDGWMRPARKKVGPLPAIQPADPTLSRVRKLLANVDEALEGLRGIRHQLEDSRTQLREIVSAARRESEGGEDGDESGTLL